MRRSTIWLGLWLVLCATQPGFGMLDPDATRETGQPADCDPLEHTFYEAAFQPSARAAAVQAGNKLLKKWRNKPARLNEFAWMILTDELLAEHDVPLALRAARTAFEKTNGKQFAIVDTYARALFMSGQTNEAVAMQRNAIDLCRNPATRLELRETLATYLHPPPDPGPDDQSLVTRFTRRSYALVDAKETVNLRKLLSGTDLAPFEIRLARPSTVPMDSERLYDWARRGVLLVGTFQKNQETDEWEMALASGFVIHESGIFITNFHVLSEPDAQALTVMTHDGRVYAVEAVLAVNPFADIAICRLRGASGLQPLPLVPNAKPGAHVRVLSHPDNALFSLTEGILSRYFVYRDQGKATTMLSTTAEFAVGSSGAPLFDHCGNVIGMVASTSSVYSGPEEFEGEEPAEKTTETVNSRGDLQMVVRMCVPSSEILKLVRPAASNP